MIEVFKTNIRSTLLARKLTREIRLAFPEYDVHFDLQDCDRILRIESSRHMIEVSALISFLSARGTSAEILEDIIF